jgi:hypothetical protein
METAIPPSREGRRTHCEVEAPYHPKNENPRFREGFHHFR